MSKDVMLVRNDWQWGIEQGFCCDVPTKALEPISNKVNELIETIADQANVEYELINVNDQCRPVVEDVTSILFNMEQRLTFVVNMDPILHQKLPLKCKMHRRYFFLDVGRAFKMYDTQTGTTKRISRPESCAGDIEAQYEAIAQKINDQPLILNHILYIDDDSQTGYLFKQTHQSVVKALRGHNFRNVTFRTLTDSYKTSNQNVVDIIDVRDFIIGAYCAGLIVEDKNGYAFRTPYLHPYVNLQTRTLTKDYWAVNQKIIELNRTIHEVMPGLTVGSSYFIDDWLANIGLLESERELMSSVINKVDRLTYHILTSAS